MQADMHACVKWTYTTFRQADRPADRQADRQADRLLLLLIEPAVLGLSPFDSKTCNEKCMWI